MIFENKTAGEICRQIKDPAQNGGKKTLEEIIEHIHTPLVAWGWDPGSGRTPAPGTYQGFVEKMTEWANKGGACPD